MMSTWVLTTAMIGLPKSCAPKTDSAEYRASAIARRVRNRCGSTRDQHLDEPVAVEIVHPVKRLGEVGEDGRARTMTSEFLLLGAAGA